MADERTPLSPGRPPGPRQKGPKPRLDALFLSRLRRIAVLGAADRPAAVAPHFALLIGLAGLSELLEFLAAGRRAEFYLFLPAGRLDEFYGAAGSLAGLYAALAAVRGARRYAVGWLRTEMGRCVVGRLQGRVLQRGEDEEGRGAAGIVYDRLFEVREEGWTQEEEGSDAHAAHSSRGKLQDHQTSKDEPAGQGDDARHNAVPKVDNPDQRMTNDVREVFLYLGLVLDSFAILPFVLAYYLYLLLAQIPGPAFAGFALFWLLVLAACWLAYWPLVSVVVGREERAGEQRWLHVHLRDAVARGEGVDTEGWGGRLRRTLGELVDWQMRYVRWTSFQTSVTMLFEGLKFVAVYVVISLTLFPTSSPPPSDLASRINFLAYVLEHAAGRLMVLVEHMGALSELAGYVARVGGLLDVVGWDI
ncbi:hypothetical protein DFJ74DRAFT_704499 [Hyaloraphidium curvatum]|nr:hypothetical protein DFJ74DRAFT_704499 [Hyaloraphidium curvatum]